MTERTGLNPYGAGLVSMALFFTLVGLAVTQTSRPTASFVYTPGYPIQGQAAQFTDTSTGDPTSWLWNFGDGVTSTARNPSHVFAAKGFYTVTLTSTNDLGAGGMSRGVSVVLLTASFAYSPAAPSVGSAVQFTDTSTGNPTYWRWNFGDGTSSTVRNPSHAYAAAGPKSVILTVANSLAGKRTSQTVNVLASVAIRSSFVASTASPVAGQAVQFTDTSTGTPTSWSWSFGDGTTSTLQNPSHAYTTMGSKTVTLTVSNASGSNSASMTVTVVAALTGSFTYSPASPAAGQSVQFTDTSAGTPTSWSWNFNDGSTSAVQNPSHAFSSSGTYSVALTVFNSAGSTSATRVVSVQPSSTLSASFTFNPASPKPGQSVQFTDTSTGTPISWSWSFGDGSTSTLRNPSHAYTVTGPKTVTLTVTNSTGSNSLSRLLSVAASAGIIIDHTCAQLSDIPSSWITAAKQNLHIAYGHTSHGSQLTTGMTGLIAWKGDQYAWNFGGTDGALDLREWDYGLGFGSPDATTYAIDLGNPNRSAWATATREYLNENPEINVIIWSWCYQMITNIPAQIDTYLSLMNGLEAEFPNVKFIYMTGHVTAGQLWGEGTTWSYMHYMRAKQIRDFCIANNKILYDFADIESWDPSGTWYGDKLVDDACNYDSNGDRATDRNWATDWQNAHPGEWYDCESAHSQPLNANLKAYAAWHLWARLAGWDGN